MIPLVKRMGWTALMLVMLVSTVGCGKDDDRPAKPDASAEAVPAAGADPATEALAEAPQGSIEDRKKEKVIKRVPAGRRD